MWSETRRRNQHTMLSGTFSPASLYQNHTILSTLPCRQMHWNKKKHRSSYNSSLLQTTTKKKRIVKNVQKKLKVKSFSFNRSVCSQSYWVVLAKCSCSECEIKSHGNEVSSKKKTFRPKIAGTLNCTTSSVQHTQTRRRQKKINSQKYSLWERKKNANKMEESNMRKNSELQTEH